ncbi:heat shock protein 9/12-domain-containing protein [Hygrophoropsis aurantiaca]|uniref:Heat shock protein 9/12-domain-containing protein n=1 Tax=Hygrophoropsis aurantiaca TaxID=72124 RepID=A0ACB8AL05_9AGAM|nr:heat shock protein 9/12-domain-containing protein [Hygrophoropsis aurantiaca]
MSDTGRQSMTDKAGSALKPDSQKSTTEHASDTVKGWSDSAASTVQPQGEKSTTQRMGDSVSGNSNDNQESFVDKAKNAVGMGGNQQK